MEISNELIKIFDYLGGKVGIAIDWTSNNVFPYLEQLCEKFIKWEISTSTAWIVIASAIAILALIFAIIIHCTGNGDGLEWFIFGIILTIAVFISGFQIFDIIECKTFPEKAIYDYIKMYTDLL